MLCSYRLHAARIIPHHRRLQALWPSLRGRSWQSWQCNQIRMEALYHPKHQKAPSIGQVGISIARSGTSKGLCSGTKIPRAGLTLAHDRAGMVLTTAGPIPALSANILGRVQTPFGDPKASGMKPMMPMQRTGSKGHLQLKTGCTCSILQMDAQLRSFRPVIPPPPKRVQKSPL